jgi:hypothetical protein
MEKIKTFESFSDEKEYSFEELPKEVQEEIVQKEQQSISEYGDDYWSDPIVEGFHEDMRELGLTDIEVEWSGFWSQGDGASFTARVYNSDNKKFITEALGLKVLDEVADNIYITIRRESTRYSHHNTMTAHVEVDGDEEIEKDMGTGMIITIDVAEACGPIEEAAGNWARDRAKKLYDDLETAYNEQLDADNIIEDLIARGEKYDISGNPGGKLRVYYKKYIQEIDLR